MNSETKLRVRDVSDLVTKGTTPTSLGRKFTSSGVNFLKVETFASDGKFIPGREAFIDASTHKLLRRSQLDEGDILFSIAGALGRSTVVEEAWLPANTNQALAIIRPSKIRRSVLPRYLLWQLRSSATMQRIAEINVQAAQANLSLEQVRDFEIPLVSLPEQRAIAVALDDANDLITTLERLITKKQAIKQGMMQQLLTGRMRLPGFTKPWKETVLGEVLTFEVGFPFRSDLFTDTPVGVRLVRNRDLKPTDMFTYYTGTFENRYIVRNEDVLIGMDGDFSPCRWRGGRALLNQRVGRLKAKRCSVSFMHYALIEPLRKLEAGTGATTVKHLSHSDIEGLVLNLPSPEEQIAIAQVLEDSDAEIYILNERLKKAREIKTGMMQQLLTERTRLPVEVAS